MNEFNCLTQNYTNPFKYAELVAKSGLTKMPPLIITCAITGSVQGKEANPNLPETLEEQVQSTYDAYNAGAAMVHIHRRDPENPAVMTQDPALFLEVNREIRRKCPDLIINNTCIGGHYLNTDVGVVEPAVRVSFGARPEVASLDITSGITRYPMKARPGIPGREKDILLETEYSLSISNMIRTSREMLTKGTKPEYEMFSLNDIKYLKEVIASEGASQPPYWISLIVNGAGTWPTPETLIQAGQLLPENSMLNIISVGACQPAVMAMAICMGYNIRVGMEDSFMYGPKNPAISNAQLVERAVDLARLLGRPIATPAQAREMMGLGGPRQYEG